MAFTIYVDVSNRGYRYRYGHDTHFGISDRMYPYSFALLPVYMDPLQVATDFNGFCDYEFLHSMDRLVGVFNSCQYFTHKYVLLK